jgi:hypothetical protein
MFLRTSPEFKLRYVTGVTTLKLSMTLSQEGINWDDGTETRYKW